MKNAAAFVLFLVLTAHLQADQLFLRSGQVVEGQITAQSRTAVTIKTATGVITVQKAEIRRIVFGAVKTPDDDKTKKEAEERLKKLKEEREKRQKERDDQDREKDELEKRREEERLKETATSEPELPEEKPVTLGGALVRSALFPGWGQSYQGRKGMGGLYMGSFLLLAGTTGGQYANYAWLKKQYQAQNRRNFVWSPLGFDMLGGGVGLSSSTISSSDFNAIGLHYQWQTISTRQKMEAAAARTNLAATALLGLYAWNLADVVLFHEGEAGLTLLPVNDGMAFAFTARF